MKINQYHLTYCTNIHPGEHWNDVFQNLTQYTQEVKRRICPNQPFGIGLRISQLSVSELLEGNRLSSFKDWLESRQMYVFTLNGFPYGNFHRQSVKDQVHEPDWATRERLQYTLDAFYILSELLPDGTEGGISTSPISYKPWFNEDEQRKESVIHTACLHFAEVAKYLAEKEQEKGCFMHLDIEPEPDGVLENTKDVLNFYSNYLLPIGSAHLAENSGVSQEKAKGLLLRYIQVCYDVCHFSLMYEEPEETFSLWKKAGISVGKIQLSAALKVDLTVEKDQKTQAIEILKSFDEPIYLHQVIGIDDQQQLHPFRDLPEAIPHLMNDRLRECSIHFHVPIFISHYELLESTQAQLIKVLAILTQETISPHLEVETYTWEVLPKEIQLDIVSSIEREMMWVNDQLDVIK